MIDVNKNVNIVLNYIDNIFILQGEKIQTILKAANVNVDSYWPGLFAKALEGVNVKELITNIGSGVGAAPVGAGGTYTFFCIALSYYNSKLFILILCKF